MASCGSEQYGILTVTPWAVILGPHLMCCFLEMIEKLVYHYILTRQ